MAEKKRQFKRNPGEPRTKRVQGMTTAAIGELIGRFRRSFADPMPTESEALHILLSNHPELRAIARTMSQGAACQPSA